MPGKSVESSSPPASFPTAIVFGTFTNLPEIAPLPTGTS